MYRSIRNGGYHLEQAKLSSFVVFSLCIFWAREYNVVTDWLSNEAVFHQKEAIEMYHRMPWSVFMFQY